MSILNYVNYNNKIGLIFAIKEMEDFTWMKDKYEGIFIKDIKNNNIIKNILGYVPNNWDTFFIEMKQNKELIRFIEDLFVSVYSTIDDSKTLVSDVTGNNLYVVSGTQINSECNINSLKDVHKIYNLNPNCEDYTDIFGHEIKFHIQNEFIIN